MLDIVQNAEDLEQLVSGLSFHSYFSLSNRSIRKMKMLAVDSDGQSLMPRMEERRWSHRERLVEIFLSFQTVGFPTAAYRRGG